MIRKLKPFREVQLESKNFKLRVILLVVCLVIAFVSIGFGIKMLVTKQSGWQKVEVSASEINCGEEFTLQYCFGQGQMSATEEYRAVTLAYSQACQQAYKSFYKEGELKQLSAAPNESVTVSQPLYWALEQVEQYDSRYLYLAPVYVEYNRVFLCESEVEASQYDPSADSEQQQWLAQLAAYANDPQAIRVELLGENTVKLVVSEDYLNFAKTHEITEFLDFGWLRNAFIADYIAEELIAAGYDRGYIASYDGFARNMDSGNYTQNLFHREGNDILLPATVSYNGPAGVVYLRSYPMSAADRWHYFVFADGHVVSDMADPADGTNKNALPELLACGQGKGCAEIALQLAPVFIAEKLDRQMLITLADAGIYSVFVEDKTVFHTQQALTVTIVEADYQESSIIE